MLHQWACQKIETVFFGLLVVFLNICFCITKFGIKTNVPIFKFVAGVNHEFTWE